MRTYQNVRRLRKAHGLTQAELGKIAGVTDKAVSTWERGDADPRMGAIEKMAAYFGVPKSVIIGDDDSKETVPLLGRIPAGTENWICENIEDYIPYHADDSATYFALRITGDSMTPTLLDGDIIFVKAQPIANTGDIAVVSINGTDATCKEIHINDGGIMLIGHNPNVYTPHFYTAEEVQSLPVTIRGVVVAMKRVFIK